MSVSLTQAVINNLFNSTEYAIPIASQTASVAAEMFARLDPLFTREILIGTGAYAVGLARRTILNHIPTIYPRNPSYFHEVFLLALSLVLAHSTFRRSSDHLQSIQSYLASCAFETIMRWNSSPHIITYLIEYGVAISQESSLINVLTETPTISVFASNLTHPCSIFHFMEGAYLLLINGPARLRETFSLTDELSFSLDFEDAGNNPRQILLKLLPMLKNGNFPRVIYLDSIGLDVGGLSRDLVTRLMGSLFHPDHPQLPTKPKTEKEQYVPIVDDQSKIPRAEQLNSYRAIGGIFAEALDGGKEITTGSHLQPAIFHMLYSLTSNLLDKIPEDFSSLDEVPKPILVKLIRAYVKAEMPTMPEEWLTRILNDRFDDEFREMTGYESRDHFIQTIGFDKIAPAVLAIAQGMKKNLRHPWEQVKGVSAEDLQRNIEGTLSVEEVRRAFGWPEAYEAEGEGVFEQNKDAQTLAFLKRWVNEASLAQLEDFAQAISGSRSLRPGVQWTLQIFNEERDLPSFHTCTPKMDLPNGYGSYEVFKAKLEMAVAESIAVAPQFI